jgi:polyisoprenoid-binding protein YceI
MLKKLPLLVVVVCLFVIPARAVAPVKYSADANHSNVGFSIPILGGLSSVSGKFSDFTVTIQYDESDITKSSVEAVIKAASIDTGVENRDKHLRTADFFDVEKYPEITFKSSSVVKKGKGFIANGTFTMHGVSKEISIAFMRRGTFVNPANNKSSMGFTAQLELNRRDYGMNWQHQTIKNWVGDVVSINLAVLVRN